MLQLMRSKNTVNVFFGGADPESIDSRELLQLTAVDTDSVDIELTGASSKFTYQPNAESIASGKIWRSW